MTSNIPTGKAAMGFVAAMRDFFGNRPGNTIGDFAAELKALSVEDRALFAERLRANGYVNVKA